MKFILLKFSQRIRVLNNHRSPTYYDLTQPTTFTQEILMRKGNLIIICENGSLRGPQYCTARRMLLAGNFNNCSCNAYIQIYNSHDVTRQNSNSIFNLQFSLLFSKFKMYRARNWNCPPLLQYSSVSAPCS